MPAAIAGGDRKLPDRLTARRDKGKIPVHHWGARPGSAAAAEEALVPDVELTQQPIKPELLQIVLRDLDKLRLDLDLLRTGDAGLLHQSVDQVEVVLCVAHDESAALRKEICTRARRERDALRGEIILRCLAAHQLTSAGGFLRVAPGPNGRSAHGGRLAGESRGPDVYTAGDESRRHPVFLREHVAALFAQGNDRNRVRFHLHLQARLARDVAQRLTEGNLVERNRDARVGRRDG